MTTRRRRFLKIMTGALVFAVALWFTPSAHAAPTLGDPTTKTTLGNDIIGGSKFIYSLGGLSIGTTTTSTDTIILGVGGLRFFDGTTQTTAGGGGSTNYWSLSGVNLFPTSTTYKVAIGGTVATSSLTVLGDGTFYGASGNLSAGVYYDRTNTAYYLDPGANENAYSLTVAGSVGIGTTGPRRTVEVVGQVAVSGSSGSLDMYRRDTNVLSWAWYSPAGDLRAYKYDGAGDLFTISTAGNVGIATTTPQHVLSIAGAFYSFLKDKGDCTGAVTINWNEGNTQRCRLTGNVVFTFTNGQPGGNYRLILKQDATGGRTVTWPGATSPVRWSGGTAPTLTTTANKTDYIGFIYNFDPSVPTSTYDGVAFNANF